MIWKCIGILGITLISILVIQNDSEAIDNNTDSQTALYVLANEGGVLNEYYVDLTEDDLYVVFPEDVVSLLLNGTPVRLSSMEALSVLGEIISDLRIESIDQAVILFGPPTVPATLGCIKCCWMDPPMACCCKIKEDFKEDYIQPADGF
jgi:hypothetical protein